MSFPRFAVLAASLLAGFASAACQPSLSVTVPATVPAPSAVAPVPPPRPSITGCVESTELKRYVLALEQQRREARAEALAALGASSERRAGAEGPAQAELGTLLDISGKRYVVAAQVAAPFALEAALARIGVSLYRLEERPRAHPTPVLVCGVQRCAAPASAPNAAVPARPVLVELQAGEQWGGSLELGYDFWWADVRYDGSQRCASKTGFDAGPAATPPAPQPRASSAASATP